MADSSRRIKDECKMALFILPSSPYRPEGRALAGTDWREFATLFGSSGELATHL
jgi:hypothetical protein